MEELSASGCVVVVLGPGVDDGRDCARRLLLATAARVLRRPVGSLELVTAPEAPPVVRRGDGAATGLHASLSHAPGVVAVALSGLGPVGVDVERLRAVPAAALARRWYAPAEASVVSGLSTVDAARAFLGLWTQKEAVGKALGRGLRGSGTRREMPVTVGRDRLVAVPGAPGAGVAAWWHDDIAVAVACLAPGAAGAEVRVLDQPGQGRTDVSGQGPERRRVGPGRDLGGSDGPDHHGRTPG